MAPRVIQVLGVTPKMITKPMTKNQLNTENSDLSPETIEKAMIIGITALSCAVLLILTIWLRSCLKLSFKRAPVIDMKHQLSSSSFPYAYPCSFYGNLTAATTHFFFEDQITNTFSYHSIVVPK